MVAKGSVMDVFILLGSKGGAGRTASSIVLAAGLKAIGLRPLHLQLTLAGCPPVIAGANGVPFPTSWLPDEHATPQSILRRIQEFPECTAVVIDTPKQLVAERAFLSLQATMLLPMQRQPHEVEVAIRDFRELKSLVSANIGTDRESIPHQSAVWLLPVGWPEGFRLCDFASTLKRFGITLQSENFLMPGIPDIRREHLDDLINGTTFRCSRMIRNAAMTIARMAVEGAHVSARQQGF